MFDFILIIIIVEEKRKLRVYSIRAELNRIDGLKSIEFKKWCMELLQRMGYFNIHSPEDSGDFGADIICYTAEDKIAIHCRKYTKNEEVSAEIKSVQETKVAAIHYSCNRSIVITNKDFAKAVWQFARESGVIIWNRATLSDFMSSINEAVIAEIKNKREAKISTKYKSNIFHSEKNKNYSSLNGSYFSEERKIETNKKNSKDAIGENVTIIKHPKAARIGFEMEHSIKYKIIKYTYKAICKRYRDDTSFEIYTVAKNQEEAMHNINIKVFPEARVLDIINCATEDDTNSNYISDTTNEKDQFEKTMNDLQNCKSIEDISEVWDKSRFINRKIDKKIHYFTSRAKSQENPDMTEKLRVYIINELKNSLLF